MFLATHTWEDGSVSSCFTSKWIKDYSFMKIFSVAIGQKKRFDELKLFKDGWRSQWGGLVGKRRR